MKRILGVILVLLLATSFLAACGRTGIKEAEFILSDMFVSPSTAIVNETITISATITNVEEVSGDCDVNLIVNGYTDSKSVTLAGGESSSVSFSYDAIVIGSYSAEISTINDIESKTFTVIKEEEGGLHIDDIWVLNCSYKNSGGNTEQDTSQLTVMVVGEETIDGEDCYKFTGVFEPAATRDAADMPLTLHIESADIWTSKDHMVYLKLSSAIKELPGLPSNVTWTLTGDYGYPFTEGKTWSGSVRVVAGVLDEITDLEFKVLGEESIIVPAGTFDCWHMVAYEPTSPSTYVNEYWFNETEVKSVVKEIERSLWAGVETRVLSSYSVSNENTTPNGNLTPNGNATQGGLIMGVNWTEMNETEFLAAVEKSGLSFTSYDKGERGIVYEHRRKIDNVRVVADEIHYQFHANGTFDKMRAHWTEGLPDTLPEVISEQEAIDIVGANDTTMYLAFVESIFGTLNITIPTSNPCWVVRVWEDYYDSEGNTTYTWNVDVVVVDAVTGEIVGHGTPLPC